LTLISLLLSTLAIANWLRCLYRYVWLCLFQSATDECKYCN